MPEPTTPAPAFHERRICHDWPREVRELHEAATAQYGVYLHLDYLEVAARSYAVTAEVNDGPAAGQAETTHIAAYQSLAGRAWDILKAMDDRGAALVAEWEREKAQDAEEEREAYPGVPHQAMLAPNGLIAVFNERGEQLPNFQGLFNDERRRALALHYTGPVETVHGVFIQYPEWTPACALCDERPALGFGVSDGMTFRACAKHATSVIR